ncbi:MAG: DNA polymerase III subunit gamma/tau [Spirochaetes bacterium]|nr:DNA polymerase III subunit gamma/tau [Spirochaetota bacterium]
MSYKVLARRWRPQTFSEVVYQDHVSTTIQNSIRKGRISHAYLFAGPRGVGKTTMARILAKSLNCQEGPTATPCGKCRNCIEIRDGHSFDVMEIDGASNRGIENIRELRESVGFAPVEGRYKIYIIDEVHMLTKEAFNALLKTLEEPPPHVVFIFATTEVHQVPDTILSRCQKFYFKKMTVEAIASHLATITKKEGYAIDESALYAIARAAEGSMRDAQSLLDQVISFSDSEIIREENALALLGIVPFESHVALLRFIAESRTFDAIKELERVISLGADMSRYIAQFSDILRAIRLMKYGIDVAPLGGFSPHEVEMLSSVAGLFSDEEISIFFKIVADLSRDLRFAPNERIYIEMAILDLIAARKRPSIAKIIQKLEELVPQHEGVSPEKKSHNQIQKSNTADEITIETPIQKSEDPHRCADEKNCKRNAFIRKWTKVLVEIKKVKPSLFLELSKMNPYFERTTIVLETPASLASRMLDNSDCALIQEKASAIFEQHIAVTQKIIGENHTAENARNFAFTRTMEQMGDMVPENETDPLVEKIIDLFHAEVISNKNEGEK